MCDLVARTGRHQQRYEAGCRLVAGYLHFFESIFYIFAYVYVCLFVCVCLILIDVDVVCLCGILVVEVDQCVSIVGEFCL